jgi:hypothetical protein
MKPGARNQGGTMILRWSTAGMLEAEHSFRKIVGYRSLAKLEAHCALMMLELRIESRPPKWPIAPSLNYKSDSGLKQINDKRGRIESPPWFTSTIVMLNVQKRELQAVGRLISRVMVGLEGESQVSSAPASPNEWGLDGNSGVEAKCS